MLEFVLYLCREFDSLATTERMISRTASDASFIFVGPEQEKSQVQIVTDGHSEPGGQPVANAAVDVAVRVDTAASSQHGMLICEIGQRDSQGAKYPRTSFISYTHLRS